MRCCDRRTLLRGLGATAVGTALGGCSADAGEAGTGGPTAGDAQNGGNATGTALERTGSAGAPAQTTRTYAISEGTEQEATVYVREADADGPTVYLVGGVHGDEVSGWLTASAATAWPIDAGTLVVLPRANPGAVERQVRLYPGTTNLNRQFPNGSPPLGDHAGNVWESVTRHDPDFVLDLHSSRGILALDDGMVGQNVFYSEEGETISRLEEAMAYLNETQVPDSRPDHYAFQAVPMEMKTELEMLADKVRVDLDVPAALFEVTQLETSVETQVAWTTAFVEKTLDLWGVRSMRSEVSGGSES